MNKTDLGELVYVGRAYRHSLREAIWCTLLFVLCASSCAPVIGVVGVLVPTALCLPPGALVIFFCRRNKYQIAVSEQGIALLDGKGKVVRGGFWSELVRCDWHEVIEPGVDNAGTLICHFKDRRKARFSLTHWQDWSLSSQRFLKKKILNHLLPDVLRQLNDGRSLHFGDLAVDKYGITNSKGNLPWKNVGNIEKFAVTSNGRGVVQLCIRTADRNKLWYCKIIGKIPNYFVFTAIVDSFVPVYSA